MEKRRRYGSIGILIVLIALGFSITFFKGDKGKEGMIENHNLEELLGIEKSLLTWSEMKGVVDNYEKEAYKKGMQLTEEDIYEKIKEEHGLFNALAYSDDLVIEDRRNKSKNTALINELLFSVYSSEESTLESVEKIQILPTLNLLDYKNSITDNTKRNLKSEVPVIEESHDILIADTDGFHKGDTANVGYPVIGEHIAKLTMSSGLEVEEKIPVRFSIYLDENIKLGDFVEKAKKIKVNIGDYEARPVEYLLRNPKVFLKTLEGDQEAKKVLAEYYQIESAYAFIGYSNPFSDPLMLYTIENEIDYPPSGEEIDLKREDLDGYIKYIEHLKKDKILLEDTYVEVVFEIDKLAIIEDYDLGEDFLGDYEYIERYFLEDGHEPPVITIDGVDMKLQVVTEELVENKGVYYKR